MALSVRRRRSDRSQSVNNSIVAGNVVQIKNYKSGVLATLVMIAAVLVVVFTIGSSPDAGRRAETSPSAAPSSKESKESKEFELWSSSSENVHRTLKDRGWVAGDFPVSQPYLRSVEVAAGPPGVGKAQLIVYDELGKEVIGCDRGIDDTWRIKCVFDQPIDVRRYVGRHLYLLVKRVTPYQPIRVYLSRYDVNPNVRSYVPCGSRKLIQQCPNSRSQDLNMLIYGWSRLDGD